MSLFIDLNDSALYFLQNIFTVRREGGGSCCAIDFYLRGNGYTVMTGLRD